MMSPNKLAVLIVFALLGSVSCQGRGYYYPPPSSTYPPPPAPSTPPPVYLSPPPPLAVSTPPPVYLSPPPPQAPSTPPPPPVHLSSPPPPPAPSTPPPPVHLSSPPPPPASSTPPPVHPSPPPPPAPSTPPPVHLSSPPPPPTPSTPPVHPSPPPPPTPSTPPPFPAPSTPPPVYLSPSPPPAPSTPPPAYPSPPPVTQVCTPTSPPSHSPPSPSPPTPVPAYYSPPPTSKSPPPSPSTPTPTPAPLPRTGTQLKVGYYKNKCGAYVDVEAIVKKHVNATDAGMQAGLVRLFFHDCFVRGCDGSILLDTWTNDSSLTPEKFGVPNFPSLRGYEVIDAAKDELEKACPGKVSCADIVAFAARDASYYLSGGDIKFDMPAGRYDGNVSLADETLPNLPPPFGGFDQLVKMFAAKGLDASDMITLSGAHSIGRSHCSSFTRDRFSNTSDMDPEFAKTLKASCASANGTDNTVVQDVVTPDVLDNQYYKNVLAHKVLFTSDAALTTNSTSNNLVSDYADIVPSLWQKKFAKAMVKMGGVEVKTAANGEIRRKTCRNINSRS